MSGIAAYIAFDNRPVAEHAIAALAGGIAHRGTHPPIIEKRVPATLIHAGSAGCAQPMTDAVTGQTLIFDGYIANQRQLQRDLGGGSDAELVLAAYQKWGADCPQYLGGEFAFVIWDAKRMQCFAARDHHGLRPLFYHFADGCLTLASELGAIIRSMEKRPALNRGFLAEIASAAHYSRAETAYRGIHRLTAAHGLKYDGKTARTRRYWTLPVEGTIRHKSDADYAAHYLSVLSDCLRDASRTDAPLAMDVSGGLDSSALYALAHQLTQKGALHAPEIRGYTLAGKAGSAADEVQFARDTAAHVSGSLTEVALFEPSLEWFADQSWHSGDFATYTNGAMSLDMERAAVRDGCRVSIGGNGGDQWLDGTGLTAYQSYRALDAGGLAAGLSATAQQAGLGAATSIALRDFVRAAVPASLRRAYRLRQRGASAHGSAFWLAKDLRQELREKQADHARAQLAEPLARLKYEKLENAQFQWAIELAERQMAREGLESRSPMLARGFIEFSAATPEHIRRRGMQAKYVHRLAMQDILPPSVVERTHEASFPETEDIRLELLSFLDGLSGDAQLFDPAGLERLSARYKAGEVDGEWAWAVWGCFISAKLIAQNTLE